MTYQGNVETILMDVSRILIAPENPRTEIDETDPAFDELAENIAANGILSPILCYPQGEHFYATAGGRRMRAIQRLIDAGDARAPEEVPIRVYDKDTAIHLGVAEQVVHEKLSRRDEVRFFMSETYKSFDDKALAKLIGKSVAYVRQHRKVLELPEAALKSFLDSKIGYEHALGLTYFLEDEGRLIEVLEDVESNPNGYDLDDLRGIYQRDFATWRRSKWAEHVTEEAYLAAGGELECDLFSDDKFIRSPAILRELGTAEIERKVTEDSPNPVVIRVEDTYRCGLDMHRGLNETTPEEEAWLDENRWEWDFESDEAKAAHKAKVAEIEARRGLYPEALTALLVTVWDVSDHGYTHVRTNLIPEDREPLYEAGFLTRPEDVPEADGDAPGPVEKVSMAHAAKIEKIKRHAVRQDYAARPDEVLEIYHDVQFRGDAHEAGPALWFDRDGEVPVDVELATSKAFDKLREASEKREGRKPAEIKAAMAYQILRRVIGGQAWREIAPERVRLYFTPDADFLKAYSKEQLLSMLEQFAPETAQTAGSMKKAALCEMVADKAKGSKDWLPIGF